MPIDFEERALIIEQYILQVRNSVRLAWILSLAVFVCGIFFAILIYLVAGEKPGLIGAIGSCVITLFSALPLKDYFSQKAKISTFEFLKTRYERLNENPKKAKDLELDKLENIFWKLAEKYAGA